MDMMPEMPATFRSEQPAKVIRVLSDDGTLDPPPRSTAERKRRDRDLYRWMVTTRQLDERLVALQRQGRIGFHVGSLGEEAAIIGSAFAMRQSDWLFPCYREFGAALMRGLGLQKFMDNMFGNANDTVQGRQMPNHITSRETGFNLRELSGRHADHASGPASRGEPRSTVRTWRAWSTSGTARPAPRTFTAA